MKRILLILSILLISCEELKTIVPARPVGYLTTGNEIIYAPKKDVYKTEEMIKVTFSFSPILLDEKDKRIHIQEVAGNLPEKITVKFPHYYKENISTVHIVLNGKKLESAGEVSFVYDKDKDRYILADNLAFLFHKKGTYALSNILDMTSFQFNWARTLFMTALVAEQQLTIEE
ncbi:hypothetical protein CAPN001_20710 [Capnocytophaga stomatis]|uniref:Lipoprotein n=1 Tax=Capnocytophaga felis TaxID=2267611 RepID=A0A5M4B960_9FLAO|nr:MULTISPECIES: hypothetical protein [Capnocytophaga]GET46153.1 hypothetical protein RCZ01_14550 [Capnocytophaga felis]GIJ97502.1 hypothetical protein CAPN001_20710 [Capnocytophaga stomatis]